MRSAVDSADGVAGRYAAALLAAWSAEAPSVRRAADPHPALEWARSGAMALTGPAGGAPQLAPGPLAACARGAIDALRALAGEGGFAGLDAAALLGERAACLGLTRRGRVSPGGSCRLVRASNGWVAVNLARPDDRALLPAWLGEGDARDAWGFVRERLATRTRRSAVARARLIGLPVAPVAAPARVAPPWFRVDATGPTAGPGRERAAYVLDLSALWAGPLCTHLLQLAGARVVKLESTSRPDGARAGSRRFFDLMNAGKRSVALDLRTPGGRRGLRTLLRRADVVVESARPRALAQLGVDAVAWVKARPGRTWLGLTGYGRRAPRAGWVAFGDDAGAAAGLAAATGGKAAPLFCGDALADPLAGLHAAVAAFGSWRAGGGHLIDVSLCDAAAHALGFEVGAADAAVRETRVGFEVVFGGAREEVRPPRARRPRRAARPLGADTHAVLREAALAC